MSAAENRAAFRANPDDPRHGSSNGYTNLGCRCDDCREAWRVHHSEWMSRHPEQRYKHRLRSRVARGVLDDSWDLISKRQQQRAETDERIVAGFNAAVEAGVAPTRQDVAAFSGLSVEIIRQRFSSNQRMYDALGYRLVAVPVEAGS